MKKKNTFIKSISIVPVLVFFAIFSYALINIAMYMKDKKEVDMLQAEFSAIVGKVLDGDSTGNGSDVNGVTGDGVNGNGAADAVGNIGSMADYQTLFDELRAKNPDVVAWIWINGTKINYPVVQTDDNEFYLHHDSNKKQNNHGAIFMDYRNNKDFSDTNTILFGHNMHDGTMFKGLLKFLENPPPALSICILTEMGLTEWEVFAAYEAEADAELFDIGFEDEARYEDYLQNALRLSKMRFNVQASTQDRILTLATCTNANADYRVVVFGRSADLQGQGVIVN